MRAAFVLWLLLRRAHALALLRDCDAVDRATCGTPPCARQGYLWCDLCDRCVAVRRLDKDEL